MKTLRLTRNIVVLLMCLVLSNRKVPAGSTNITVEGVTPTQAVLTYTAPDDRPCQVQVFEKRPRQLVADFDDNLFPGASSDARLPASGPNRIVVAGLRTAQLAADGIFHSRALQAATAHEATVRCGTLTAGVEFVTANPPLGNTFPEMPRFDSAAFGNVAWPTVDWATPDRNYIDPLTGVLLKRATSAGDYGGIFAQRFAFALDSRQAWASADKAISGDPSSFATISSSQASLFLGVGEMNLDYNNAAGFGLYSWSVDDLQEAIWAASSEADPADRTLSICLSVDSGQSCATRSFTVIVPRGSSLTKLPASNGTFPLPAFQRWTKGLPLARHFIAPPSGEVDVFGHFVILKSFSPVNWFDIEWKPGTKIFIEGSGATCPQQLCTIAEVGDSTQLRIEESLTPYTTKYRGANFGLMVRKTTSRGNIQATFSYQVAGSKMFTLPLTGASDLCSRNAITNSRETGYLCVLQSTSGYSSLYFFIPTTGEVRLLSNFSRPYTNDPYDGGGGLYSVIPSSFDPRDGRVFYAMADTGTGPYYRAVFRGRYTGDMSGKPRDHHIIQSDSITWNNLTPKSRNRDLVSQLTGLRSDYNPSIFNYIQPVGVAGSQFVFTALSGQDAPCIIGFVNLKSGTVTARDSWSDPSGRWGTCHSIQPIADGWLIANMNPARAAASSQALVGPWQIKPTILYRNGSPSTDTSLPADYADACPEDLAPAWKTLGAVGRNCVRVIVRGEPCSATPTELEKERFPCPQDPSRSLLQPLTEGDLLTDFTESVLHERFRVVRKTPLTDLQFELTLQRRALCSEGLPDRLFQHANGFMLSVAQSGGCYSAGWWLNTNQLVSSWLLENPLLVAGHFDVGTASTGRYTSVTGISGGYLVRPNQPPLDQFGQPFGLRLSDASQFAGSKAAITEANEPYPSVRQWNAPDPEKRWLLDFRAYQAGFGASGETPLRLFDNAVTPVTGTSKVYRINNPRSGLDRKRLPVIAWVGRYWLHDVSGPNSMITDEQEFSFCIATLAGECRPESRIDEIFINAPHATIASPTPYCATNHYASSLPCLLTANAAGASVVQWDMSRSDPSGINFRRLTMGLSGPGRQYTFSNAHSTPDGGWAMFPGFWLDGYRNDVLLAKLPPWPADDSIRRNDFQLVTRMVSTSNEARIRVRFGYAENGPPSSFYCTTRQEACVASGSPFSWLHEAKLGISCEGTCVVQIPAISGRVLFYQVDRLSDTGILISSDPLVAVPIP